MKMPKTCRWCSCFNGKGCDLRPFRTSNDTVSKLESEIDEGKVYFILEELLPIAIDEDVTHDVAEAIQSFVFNGINEIKGDRNIEIIDPDHFGCIDWR